MVTTNKTPPLHPTVTDPPGRWPRRIAAFAGVAALALSAGLAGCAEGKTEALDGDREEHVGSAEQALAQTCITVTRTAAAPNAVRDTYISGYKTSYNYGSQQNLVLSSGRYVLLRFDLSSVPDGAPVESATLALRVNAVLPGHGAFPAAVEIHPLINGSWVESSVTWGNFSHAFDADVTATFGSVLENQPATADVKSMVQAWVNGATNRGFLLESGSPNQSDTVDFVSSDYGSPGSSFRPQLQVCYYPNLCAPNPCQNGGTCTQSSQTYSCACPAGTSGANCQVVADPCSPNPCKGGGTCSANGAAHTCQCPAGRFGDKCQFWDVCGSYGSSLCLNGGTCTNKPGEWSPYSCECPDGYSGKNCQISSCQCATADPYWSNILTWQGVETQPTGMGEWAQQCQNASVESTSRGWFPTWMFPTLNKSYTYIQYLKSFYKTSPNYCRWIDPYYFSVLSPSNPGVLAVFDDQAGNSMCVHPYGGTFKTDTAAKMAACKTDIVRAPHVVPQLIPDLPFAIGVGAPALLALAEILRRRRGRKVAK